MNATRAAHLPLLETAAMLGLTHTRTGVGVEEWRLAHLLTIRVPTDPDADGYPQALAAAERALAPLREIAQRSREQAAADVGGQAGHVAAWLGENIPCVCHEGYYERGLVAPDCEAFAHPRNRSDDGTGLLAAANELLAPVADAVRDAAIRA